MTRALLLLTLLIGGCATTKGVMPNHAGRKSDGQQATQAQANTRSDVAPGASQAVAASPVRLIYTIPAYQRIPGTCGPDVTQAAHVDSVRVLAWYRLPYEPWDNDAWIAARALNPRVVLTKYIGWRTGQDTIEVLLPAGTTVRVVPINAAGAGCESNLSRGSNE